MIMPLSVLFNSLGLFLGDKMDIVALSRQFLRPPWASQSGEKGATAFSLGGPDFSFQGKLQLTSP